MIRNSVYSLIKKRKSIRSFLNKPVERNKITKILDAGHWAPSGLNNQPWRFVVIKDKPIKDKISEFSKYSYIMKGADCLILVFLDKLNSYNLIKDAQAIGACIQNMLLFALELGVSSCWLGEIINKKDDINKFIKIDSRYDLMAAVAFGYSKTKTQSKRFPLDKLILREIL